MADDGRGLQLSSEPGAPAEAIESVIDSINRFNMRVTGDESFHQVAIFVRDGDGEIRGGITGGVWGGWLHVVALWVDEDLRGQGLGTELLLAAEAEARGHGARGAFLETHTFQAPSLYRRHGYETIAEIEDYPPGESQLIMRKSLG